MQVLKLDAGALLEKKLKRIRPILYLAKKAKGWRFSKPIFSWMAMEVIKTIKGSRRLDRYRIWWEIFWTSPSYFKTTKFSCISRNLSGAAHVLLSSVLSKEKGFSGMSPSLFGWKSMNFCCRGLALVVVSFFWFVCVVCCVWFLQWKPS